MSVVGWRWEGQACGSGTESSSTAQSRGSALREALLVSSPPLHLSFSPSDFFSSNPQDGLQPRAANRLSAVHTELVWSWKSGLHRVTQPCGHSGATATQPADKALPAPRAPFLPQAPLILPYRSRKPYVSTEMPQEKRQQSRHPQTKRSLSVGMRHGAWRKGETAQSNHRRQRWSSKVGFQKPTDSLCLVPTT